MNTTNLNETASSHSACVFPGVNTEPTTDYGVEEICSRLGISRATFYRLRQSGQIPAPLIKRFPPVCLWPAEVVDQLVATLAKRD